MKSLKRLISAYILLLCSFAASAYDFFSGGCYFNIIDYENALVEIANAGDGFFIESGYKGDVVIPETVVYDEMTYQVVRIGYYAFYNCDITSVRIPASIKDIDCGHFSTRSAFSNCEKLESIVVDEYNPWYDSRENCNAIIKTGTNTLIAGCKNTLIPVSVTAIGRCAFDQNSNLESIEIPNSVTLVDTLAFCECTNLTNVIFSDDSQLTNIGYGAFKKCSNLTSINLPAGVTLIERETFSGCSNLTSIEFSADSQLTSIGYEGFRDCSSLTSITIPKGVTSIGDNAFRDCSSLTSITIPEGVTSIGESAFRDCKALTTIISLIPIEDLFSTDAFYGVDKSNCYLIVPSGAKERYSQTGGWNQFVNIIEVGESQETGKHLIVFIAGGEVISSYLLEYGAPIVVPEDPEREGHTFNGWGEIPETMPTKDVIVTGSFTVNVYTVTYILDGEVFKIEEVAYGTAIPTPDVPFKENYSFSGWNEMPETMPAKDVVVAGSYTSNFYPVTYIIDGEVFEVEDVAYGAAIPTPIPTKEGYTFCGWENVPETMPARDVVVTGTFTVNFYPVTYIIDGEVFEVEDVAYGATIPTPTPTKEGYIFGGWENVPETMPARDVVVTGTFMPNVYRVTYILNGEVFREEEVVCGSPIPTPEEPYMDGYSFSGWSEIPETMPADDVTVTGSLWENAFNVIYMLDGEVFKTEWVMYGTTPIPPAPEVPEREGYTLSGWSEIPETMPAEDVVITGSFTVNSYTITYVVDGEVYKSVVYNYGESVSAEDTPMKEGYTFSDWSEVPETMPASDVIVTGAFFINTYLVTFKIDGEVIAVDSLEYGATIVAPEAIEKEGHTFSGWGKVTETVPASDVTYEGSYTVNTYLLTYVVDGETVLSDSVAYGTAIVALEEPAREGYTFSGWSEVPETMPASDVIVTGAFTINTYLVTFKIGDEMIAADSLEYGAAIVVPEAPEKAGYTFGGWTNVPETVPARDVVIESEYVANEYLLAFVVDGALYELRKVRCDAKIEALDIAEREGYTLVWENWIDKMPAKDYTIRGKYVPNKYGITYIVDGETIQNDSVEYGTVIVLPGEPIKEGYTFSGWSEAPETMPAEDLTISGTFTINKYLVTFKIGDEVIASDSLEYGATIVAPEAPAKEGHTFNGWGEVDETVPAHDVTYEGSYSANSYLLTFVVDGEIVQSDSMAYGTTIVALEEPTMEGHTFSGWSEIPETMPAEDVVIRGFFTVNTYKVYYYVGDELVHTAEVAYGEAIPEYVYEPTAEGDVFVEWVGETYETMPAHDVTYTANIESGIDVSTLDSRQTVIYDLNGRKILVADLRELERGVYIIDNKKVVIK